MRSATRLARSLIRCSLQQSASPTLCGLNRSGLHTASAGSRASGVRLASVLGGTAGTRGAGASLSARLGLLQATQPQLLASFSRHAAGSIERQAVLQTMTLALSTKLPELLALAVRGPSTLSEEEQEAEDDEECTRTHFTVIIVYAYAAAGCIFGSLSKMAWS